jgi:hypothetical protein
LTFVESCGMVPSASRLIRSHAARSFPRSGNGSSLVAI